MSIVSHTIVSHTILIDKLPTSIGGNEVNSDFRTILICIEALNDTELSEDEKIATVLKLFYKIEPCSMECTADLHSAVCSFMWFLQCGSDNIVSKNDSEKTKNNEQAICYTQDADLIYSAFYEQYGIDLQDIPYLHWWKFKALLNGLNENCLLSKIIGYRITDISKMKGEQRKFYESMKKKYKIKTPDILQREKEDKILLDILKNGGNLNGK